MADVKVVDKPIFIKKRHELAELLGQIKRGSSEAVSLLVETMNDSDPENGIPLKTRLECATKLLELDIAITKQINSDQLMRQIAEIKAKGYRGVGGTTSEDEPRQLPPITDFSTIQTVD